MNILSTEDTKAASSLLFKTGSYKRVYIIVEDWEGRSLTSVYDYYTDPCSEDMVPDQPLHNPGKRSKKKRVPDSTRVDKTVK